MRLTERPRTGDNLDEVRTAVPDVGPVVDDHHHVGVAWKEPLQALPGHACRSTCMSARESLRPQKGKERTAALVPTQDAPAKESAVRVNDLADFDRIGPSSHRVDVHLVDLGDPLQELGQARSVTRRGSQVSTVALSRELPLPTASQTHRILM